MVDQRIGSGGQFANAAPKNGKPVRLPRRLVLLETDEQSGPREVLVEYHGAEVSGKRMHGDIRRLADEHPGSWVAAEWLGPRGWTRFVWCRR
jgi:hypothetical protein